MTSLLYCRNKLHRLLVGSPGALGDQAHATGRRVKFFWKIRIAINNAIVQQWMTVTWGCLGIFWNIWWVWTHFCHLDSCTTHLQDLTAQLSTPGALALRKAHSSENWHRERMENWKREPAPSCLAFFLFVWGTDSKVTTLLQGPRRDAPGCGEERNRWVGGIWNREQTSGRNRWIDTAMNHQGCLIHLHIHCFEASISRLRSSTRKSEA